MSNVEFRPGKKHFYDNKKFPRGFAKSGDFTLAEEDLLIRFGETMNGLEAGDMQPETEAEKLFLSELQTSEAPSDKLAKVWMKYVRLARGRKRFHTLNGRSKVDVSDDFNDDEDSISDED